MNGSCIGIHKTIYGRVCLEKLITNKSIFFDNSFHSRVNSMDLHAFIGLLRGRTFAGVFFSVVDFYALAKRNFH